MSLLPPKHILVILDACRSGIALAPVVKWRDIGSREAPLSALRARRSRRIITSALDDQVALDSGPVHGHSLFTGCLIEALMSGISRGDHGVTTGSELGLYVQRRVETYPRSRQTPDFGTFDFDDRGEMVIPLLSERLEDAEVGEGAAPKTGPDLDDDPASMQVSRKSNRVLIVAIAVTAGIIAIVGGVVFVATRGHTPKREVVESAPADVLTAPVSAPAAEPKPNIIANPWIRIDPPPAPYRLGVTDKAPAKHVGFRASRDIVTPLRPYTIQEHEVTWSELDSWLAASGTRVDYPPWATDARARARLPATGITWSTAAAYCVSLGGALPTEEQWEYAARGPERRPSPWGTDPLDLQVTHVFAGSDAVPSRVMESRQDQTPYAPRLYDFAGNVQEWTLGLWREDIPGKDESDAQAGRTTSRAIRGFPLAKPPPATIQPDSAAYRERLCATGPCVEKTRKLLAYVGFRCAKALDQ